MFKSFLESKGILLGDELYASIKEILPKIYESAIRVKETGKREAFENAITFPLPYDSGETRTVTINVINYPKGKMHGLWSTEINSVVINVGLTPIEKITEDWVYNILVHELGIHGVDPKTNRKDLYTKISRLEVPEKMNTGFYSKYMQQEHEIDAFSGEITNYIIREVPKKYKAFEAIKLLDQLLTWVKQPNSKIPEILKIEPRWARSYAIVRKLPPKLMKRFTSRIANAALSTKEKLFNYF